MGASSCQQQQRQQHSWWSVGPGCRPSFLYTFFPLFHSQPLLYSLQGIMSLLKVFPYLYLRQHHTASVQMERQGFILYGMLLIFSKPIRHPFKHVMQCHSNQSIQGEALNILRVISLLMMFQPAYRDQMLFCSKVVNTDQINF